MIGVPCQIHNATSFLVERCTVHHCGQAANPKGTQGGMGGLIFLECRDSVLQCNECHHVVTTIKYDGCAFDLDGGCSGCTMQYNYSHDNEGSGFQTGPYAGCGPLTDNTIRYNVSQNDAQRNPGSSGGIMTWGGHVRGRIYNNTVFTSAGLDGNPAAFLGSGAGLEVYNNIFVVSHDGDVVRAGGGNTFRNNCYWRTKGGFSVLFADKRYASLADWRKATGQETLDGRPLGFDVDPQLRAAGGGGAIDDPARLRTLDAYDLLPSSPLAGKGLDLRPLLKAAPGPCDFRGAPFRAGTRFDLGALQR